MQPLSIHQRTPLIDILRGWALFGVAIGNYRNFYYVGDKALRGPGPESLVNVSEHIMEYLIYTKSWTLLSILFGYGFSVLMQNIQAKAKRPTFFFAKRMFWLLFFAAINSLLYFGDILRSYAILGLLLTFFHKTSAKRVFYSSVALMLILPFVSAWINTAEISYALEIKELLPLYYSHNWLDYFTYNLNWTLYYEILDPDFAVTNHMMMFSCMLLGVAAHRSDFFASIVTNRKIIKHMFWICLITAIILNLAYAQLTQLKSLLLHYFEFHVWAIVSITLTIASGICWLYLAGQLKRIFTYFQTIGRMTLTNYIMQCALIALIFSGGGLGLFNTMPYWFYLVVPLVIYIMQLMISRYWLSKHNYGPLEWIWRKLSYGKMASHEDAKN